MVKVPNKTFFGFPLKKITGRSEIYLSSNYIFGFGFLSCPGIFKYKF